MELIVGDHIILIDDEDLGKFLQFKWYIIITNDDNKYVSKTCNSKSKLMHHEVFGKPDKGFYIDHINGNGLDNRKCNLRICTNQTNQGNRKISKNNTSGYKGVGWSKDKEKWRAYICVNRQYKHLGYFDNKIEAAKAYDKAALEFFKEFARLNFYKGE